MDKIAVDWVSPQGQPICAFEERAVTVIFTTQYLLTERVVPLFEVYLGVGGEGRSSGSGTQSS